MKKIIDIDFALVEETRPPIYTAMKYWGKKPHNIWRRYIENYTPVDGLFLDPFTGSAISAFEAVKAGKKAIAFDLNPLSSFIIEAISSPFDKNKFANEVQSIEKNINSDKTYKYYFSTTCRKCGSNNAVVQNFKWNSGKIYELGIECHDCNKSGIRNRYTEKPIKDDVEKLTFKDIEFKFWIPDKPFPNSTSFSSSFISMIGGNNYKFLWTDRNLYILSKIFDLIQKVNDEIVKKQLLFGFIQTIHLCTKMSVPRRDAANRPFSTSWGRSAYICAKRQMEMNALLVFIGSCLGKQSVESCLENVIPYLGKIPKLLYVDASNKSNRSTNFDIKYGIVDINNITDYVDQKSIDFIITDPPYGGLVQYFDLSSIWLIWLEKYDSRYIPNYAAEITIKNKNSKADIDKYKFRFENGLKNLFKVLKDDGKIVFTFHNKEIKIWNAFLKAIFISGFKVEKVIHQQNRRTGESNVANPYGTSATDFYIRCIKSANVSLSSTNDQFEHFVIKKAIEIIAQRNEPTPFQILFNGLLVEISAAGFNLEDFDKNIETILSKEINKIFKLTDNNLTKAGNLWWFINPQDYIKYPNRLLTDRVEQTIISFLRREVSVTLDQVLAEIFVRYPNGLTPDRLSIDKILKKYAIKSGGKWLYNQNKVEKDFTEHTRILSMLAQIGKKMSYDVFIGKREQSETINEKSLSTFASLSTLKSIIKDKTKLDRVEMIDMLWLKDDKIICAIEVENTTNFTSGIQRASNLEIDTPKLMIIPDDRRSEFLGISDPMFKDGFNKYGWHYLFYSEIEKLLTLRKISITEISKYSKGLK